MNKLNMIKLKQSLPLLLIMLCASVAAGVLQPTKKLSETYSGFRLEQIIPREFSDWKMIKVNRAEVVDPVQEQTVRSIYAQTLSRTYENSQGYQVMLSVAYGEDQSDGVGVHYPEVCYPAQGFTLSSKTKGLVNTEQGPIPVTRLQTHLGQRYEPVTYWTTVGEHVVSGKLDKKFTEMGYGFKGFIPDGLLFRVSSIDEDTQQALSQQDKFISNLISALDVNARRRLAGLQ